MIVLLLFMLLLPIQVGATVYYISPTGSNSNDGLSTAHPFLTFLYAIDATRAGCGDTLVLRDGTYGDGTSTGKIAVAGLVCTNGNEFVIQAENQRKAKIVDNGLGSAISIKTSSYIRLDGLYSRSTNNSACSGTAANTNSQCGRPLSIISSRNVTVRNAVFYQPNHYSAASTSIFDSSVVLFEGCEFYDYHRHAMVVKWTDQIVIRQCYFNARGGRISGGFLNGNPVGTGDSGISLYPARDVIIENVIAEGAGYLIEINAEYTTMGATAIVHTSPMETKNIKILGSICNVCSFGNAVYPSSRRPGITGTVQDLTIKDVAIVNWASVGFGIRLGDCYGACVLDHITILGTDVGTAGISLFEDPDGVTSASNSATMTNILISDAGGTGLSVSGFATWTADEIVSFSNTNAFSPASSPNLTNTSTAAHGMGACKVWVPSGAAVKGAGTGGSDIGANILYRYVDGVLTTIPLWDPTTGEFPFGAADVDGVNRVVGQSLFDVNSRVNVNTGGCSFPAGYGATGPSNPSNVTVSSDLDGGHVHVIPSGMDSLTAFVSVRYDGTGVPAHATGLTSSCGSQVIPLLSLTPTVTGATAGNRSVSTFGKINPNSGTCTLTPTFSSANVSGWIMTSVHKDDVGSYGPVSAATQLNASPSVTVTANSDHVILSGLATSNTATISATGNQTWLVDTAHATKVLRMANSEILGSSGVIVSYNINSSVYWALEAVALIPPTPGGGSTSTFRVTKYRIDSLYGSESTPEVTIAPISAENGQGRVSPGQAARIRVEILVENDTSASVGVALYCRRNSGTYLRVENTFGSGAVRLYGPGFHPFMPSDNTPTTQRFSGAFSAGVTKRDASASAIIASMSVNTRTELDYQVVIGNIATHNDLINCEIRRDDGGTLGVHTVLPTISVRDESALMGF